MKMMMLFCMARVAVAVAGLAVMAYVALGCTWAAIEETAPIAESDHGKCLRVDSPLIAPGECLVGIEEVAPVKLADRTWYNTTTAIPPVAQWWLVSPKGWGYTVVHTTDLRELDPQIADETPGSDAVTNNVAMYITSSGTQEVLLGRTADYKLLMRSAEDVDVTIWRFVTGGDEPTE